MTFDYVQNDTAPDFVTTVTRGRTKAVVNLTGCTVQFKIHNNSTASRTNDAHNVCTIDSASNGVARYSFQSGDLPTAGLYSIDLAVVYPSGKRETAYKAYTLNVRAEA